MSIVDNITKGEWVMNNLYSNCIITANGDVLDIRGNEANAKLIADAGTTANKCGLLPSELLQQNTELLEALKEVVFDYKCILSSGACQAEAEIGLLEKVDKLIQKHETK